jgi:hypothetical protein
MNDKILKRMNTPCLIILYNVLIQSQTPVNFFVHITIKDSYAVINGGTIRCSQYVLPRAMNLPNI